jgi:hypothetical protein
MVVALRLEKLQQRVSGLSLIENHLSNSLDGILKSYSGMNFRNSEVDKEQFFRECLSLKLSKISEELLADRCQLSFHKDLRSSIEYGLELVFGWLSEDLLLEALRSRGISVALAGEDRHREFLSAAEIGTSSDFQILLNGVTRPLEIVFAWNNHWTTTDKWDLRDSKYRHLTQVGHESLCLGVEVPSLEGFLVDMRTVKNGFNQRLNPAWGNKSSYTLLDVRRRLKRIEMVLNEFSVLRL